MRSPLDPSPSEQNKQMGMHPTSIEVTIHRLCVRWRPVSPGCPCPRWATLMRIVAIFLLAAAGCSKADTGEHAFTLQDPGTAAVTGHYVSESPQENPGTESLMAGRAARLDLRADGTFALTDYPVFSQTSSAKSGVISVTGKWDCTVVDRIDHSQGLVAAGLPMWGIRFSSTETNLNRAYLFGRKHPYRLRVLWGESTERQHIEFHLVDGQSPN